MCPVDYNGMLLYVSKDLATKDSKMPSIELVLLNLSPSSGCVPNCGVSPVDSSPSQYSGDTCTGFYTYTHEKIYKFISHFWYFSKKHAQKMI